MKEEITDAYTTADNVLKEQIKDDYTTADNVLKEQIKNDYTTADNIVREEFKAADSELRADIDKTISCARSSRLPTPSFAPISTRARRLLRR